MALELTPISLEEANAFVATHHRNHKPVIGHKFSLAVSRPVRVDERPTEKTGLAVAGVCIVSRPVSRHLDDGWTLEVTRCCTDGTRNACSMLYRAAWRAASSIGYKRLVTYTLPSEGGASLRGAGFKLLGEAGGGHWGRVSRPRVESEHPQRKLRWEIA